MYKIPAKTLFLGKNLIFVAECHSTNDLAQQLSQKPNWIDGTLIITDNQTAGRGQRGNVWLTKPGANLTFSLLIKPLLSVQQQFHLTLFVSLGIHDYVKQRIDQKVHIKWPNDIMVGTKKLGGILIENQLAGSTISSSVVGIGLNMNQLKFSSDTAVSVALLAGRAFSLSDELDVLLSSLEKRYFQMKERKTNQLLTDYLNALFRFGETHTFESDGIQFQGKIVGVDDIGRLRIQTEDAIRVFDNKEIQFVIS